MRSLRLRSSKRKCLDHREMLQDCNYIKSNQAVCFSSTIAVAVAKDVVKCRNDGVKSMMSVLTPIARRKALHQFKHFAVEVVEGGPQ